MRSGSSEHGIYSWLPKVGEQAETQGSSQGTVLLACLLLNGEMRCSHCGDCSIDVQCIVSEHFTCISDCRLPCTLLGACLQYCQHIHTYLALQSCNQSTNAPINDMRISQYAFHSNRLFPLIANIIHLLISSFSPFFFLSSPLIPPQPFPIKPRIPDSSPLHPRHSIPWQSTAQSQVCCPQSLQLSRKSLQTRPICRIVQ
jgi:hypothetical protein